MADMTFAYTVPLNGSQLCLRPALQRDIPRLRRLWKEAFQDDDVYLDAFFEAAFDPCRCRVLTHGQALLGAAYWLNCSLENQRLAYVYAVAIARDHRGQGLGSALMDGLHRALAQQGYDGVLLVPGSESLRQYYRRFGYRTVSYHREFLAAAERSIPVTEIDACRYFLLRRQLLPEKGVIQENENMRLLARFARFYEADGAIAAVSPEDGSCFELLGDPHRAGGIAAALGLSACRVRTPGSQRPYAMGRSLTDLPLADKLYLGFGFD